MVKIINGKKYNTKTAKWLGEYDNGLGRSNFKYCIENLYRKSTGEFFLHGEGGSLSKYAKTVGQNTWCGSEKIIPLQYEMAREWAENHLSVEEYEEIFGEISEDDDEKVPVSICVTKYVAEKARREASKAGITLSEYVENKLL